MNEINRLKLERYINNYSCNYRLRICARVFLWTSFPALAPPFEGHKASTESMTKTCCPQETLLVSENSSGIAELRCLAPAPAPAPPAVGPASNDRSLL
ncbi:hypothetical protein EVAR_46660_1 [Eumeta japonica]|uniref:Uncharacterized protein n=1 Tax=Eumeta variegata TaxID=151549 RepID=A0A4C1Y6U6_EUMVA|nr:hypothetical protein EVAR_46660_1 [Eumeta japonica]